uniref:Poly [ADP-ribose] polymerase n=1 Tax=Mola mola TaxID=94237 RepID=A0A3Q3XAM5_MOLML
MGQLQKGINISLESAVKAGSTIELHVFALYNCDLIRVNIAFGKKVSQRQMEKKLEHRILRNMSMYGRKVLEMIKRKHGVEIQVQDTIITVSGFTDFVTGALWDVELLLDKMSNSVSEQEILREVQWASIMQRGNFSEVEKTLYHGTSESSVKEICIHGFNRSFSTAYGQGVYFAVNSALSVRDQYSPPNADGHKFIFVSKVLTGDYTKGCHSMKTTPLKETGDIPLRYDSVTDNITKPTMFVIFNDTQAFPEYLITCQIIQR